MNRLHILIFALVLPHFCVAQNITVINQYADTTGFGKDVQFDLKESRQHTLIINHYEPANEKESNRLLKLIANALDYYVDQSVETVTEQVELRTDAKSMMSEMEEIVADAIKFYKYKQDLEFDGFSTQIEKSIQQLQDLKLSRDFKNKPREERSAAFKILVQKNLGDLKFKIHEEVGVYSAGELMILSDTEIQQLDSASRQALLNEIDAFEQHDELSPITFEMSNSTYTLLASEDEFSLPDYSQEQEDKFAEKVLKLLETNTQQLNALQAEVDEIRAQQEREKQQAAANVSFQNQIDELRELIVTLVKHQTGVDPVGLPAKPIENLPDEVALYFDVGSIALNTASQWMLAEVVDLLARHPHLRLMVTGYADRSGNPRSNLALSRKRAQIVRRYIKNSGLDESRVVVNYFGDKESLKPGKTDRKVVVEFLQ